MLITVADGAFNAYVARPDASPAPVVVVLQEIFGVNADIRATCDELAQHGFLALAPDLFWRDAPGLDLNAWSEAEWARGLALYQAYDVDRGVRDIAATIAAARTAKGSCGRIGVMGFCLGGLMAFLTAVRTPVDAAVSYYGGGIDQHLDEAAAMRTPLLLHLAEADEFIPTTAQAAIRGALAARPTIEICSYPGCAHAFARHTGAHYAPAAAALANERTRSFLERHLAPASR